MTDSDSPFEVRDPAIDRARLEAAIAREREAARARPLADPARSMAAAAGAAAAALRARLEGLEDSLDIWEVDLPASHRAGLAGRLVHGLKALYLRLLAPFHRELLRRQRAFNEQALEVLSALVDRLESLEQRLPAPVEPAEGARPPAKAP
jgi:hypothetical protein